MAMVLRSIHFQICLCFSCITLAFAQGDNQFVFNGFRQDKLQLEGLAEIHGNGLLQLTNNTPREDGRAFYKSPIKFVRNSSGLGTSVRFSTKFVFAIVPVLQGLGGHGIAFAFSSSMNFTDSLANEYLGLFNNQNGSLSTHRIFAIELDTIPDPEFDVFKQDHVGIDENSVKSIASAPAMYFSDKEGKNISLNLTTGNPMQLWIDYDEAEKLLNVTLAPAKIPKPNRPLLSKSIDLSRVFLETMYVGFSSATGSITSNHYILGWSFNTSGPAQSLDVSSLPSLPHQKKRKDKAVLISALLMVGVVVLITVLGAAYILRQKKYEEEREDWEWDYGPHRFTYKDLYKATKGFRDSEVLGAGGFGQVYKGTLPSSNLQVAIKKVSHDSRQGLKEFVAEIVSMGRLRHRNLVQLLGYCRRKGELLLVYDYMPNGSLDKFLFGNGNSNLNWQQRFQIIRGVASGLLYLHEEWEQVVLHRDVKASNVLLDAELNGRLGDFGLAKLHDHGANPQTTRVVGTIGYLAPELTRSGRATTRTDVFAFGAFMLEVACGRRPIALHEQPERVVLVEWVFECWRNGVILDASDRRLEGNYVEDEMVLVLKLGLLCSHGMPEMRPRMRQVMQFLDGDATLPELTQDRASFGTFAINHSFDFLSMFPEDMASAPSMSTFDSILKSGR